MFLLKKRKNKVALEGILLPLFLALLSILFYYNVIFLENTRPQKILLKTLENMEQNYGIIHLEISERGEGYQLNFKGYIKDKNVFYGNITEYKLDIYKDSSGELFIKDLIDERWKKATELELDTLQNFFISPLDILSLWSHLFREAKFIDYTISKEKVISLTLTSQEESGKTLTFFLDNHLFQRPFSLECLIFIDPEELFINQMILSLYEQESRKNILSRTFTLSPSTDLFQFFPTEM